MGTNGQEIEAMRTSTPIFRPPPAYILPQIFFEESGGREVS